MKLIEPHYQLIRMDEREWRFQYSVGMQDATERFDGILDSGGGRKGLTPALRAFLNDHPSHIDALHHYAMCKMEEGKPLDAFAFAQAAVAVGRSVISEEFRQDNGMLPGGWIENRPFLRALHGLMIAQRSLYETAAAIQTARELCAFDPEDRMGARMLLPLYLLEEDRNREALEVFSMHGFGGTFHTTEYLRALALIRCQRVPEAEFILSACIRHWPQMARFLADPSLRPPQNDSPFGITMGSEYEGWAAAAEQRNVWRRTKGAGEILEQAFKNREQKPPKQSHE